MSIVIGVDSSTQSCKVLAVDAQRGDGKPPTNAKDTGEPRCGDATLTPEKTSTESELTVTDIDLVVLTTDVTTIAPNIPEIARTAVNGLLARISGETEQEHEVVCNYELRVRQSAV